MARHVVVTGAGSYLGQAIIQTLGGESELSITGILSPRGDPSDHVHPPGLSGYVVGDLTQPLGNDIKQLLANANVVLHLAWQRGTDWKTVEQNNLKMVRNVMAARSSQSGFLFMSSVASCESTTSIYGSTKFATERAVLEAGGCNLVCGLIIDDPPAGAYGMVTRLIEAVPFRIRFGRSAVKVYPVSLSDACSAIRQAVVDVPKSGRYAMFLHGGVDMDRFFEILERRTLRIRIPLLVPVSIVLVVARMLRTTPLRGMSEKIFTFFTKDEPLLASLPILPGLSIQKTRQLLTNKL